MCFLSPHVNLTTSHPSAGDYARRRVRRGLRSGAVRAAALQIRSGKHSCFTSFPRPLPRNLLSTLPLNSLDGITWEKGQNTGYRRAASGYAIQTQSVGWRTLGHRNPCLLETSFAFQWGIPVETNQLIYYNPRPPVFCQCEWDWWPLLVSHSAI